MKTSTHVFYATAITVFLIIASITLSIIVVKTTDKAEVAQIPKSEDVYSIDEMRVEFVEGCIGDDQSTRTFCTCAFDDMLSSLGKETFLKESVQYSLTDEFSDVLLEAMVESSTKCLK